MSAKAYTADANTPAVEAPFYIPATNLPARPQRTLQHNDTFAIFDSHGDIGASSSGHDGLFHCDTRYLSHLELLISGTPALLLGSAVRDDNLAYYVDLTNADVYVEGRIDPLKDTVHIGRTMYLYDSSLRQRIVLTNYGAEPVEMTLSLSFDSDFADIFEVRGIRRQRRGKVSRDVRSNASVVLSYVGVDQVGRQTVLDFWPPPARLGEAVATYALRLAPAATETIFVTASSGGVPCTTRSFFRGLLAVGREHQRLMQDIATIETSNPIVDQVLQRSLADLYMLVAATADGPYPYAGIPWYATTFGRDGLITALEMLWVDPSIAAGVLRRLARYQARAFDPTTDAAPGKILHEMRSGEMAALREIPFGLYYGSVDATPLFVALAGRYALRTGDYALIRELWPEIDRALDWIDGPGDADGDGFVEYARGSSTGLANQGWKDSFDSVFHADGRLAEGPIALAEVQGYVYAARHLAAALADALGLVERAAFLRRRAEGARERFEAAFWIESLGTYALALDGAKEPCAVRTSNAGQVLMSGIARPDRAARVAKQLMDPAFFTGWGIRTVAEGEARYNPMSYHNGSVWPHDNALIADGLAQYGHKDGIAAVFEGVMAAARIMEQRRLPELFCGFRRRRGRAPTLYPAACSPQAWAAATPFLLLRALLGLELDAAERRVHLVDPVLPASLGNVTVRNLRIGAASVDFALRRDRAGVRLEVLRNPEELEVSLIGAATPATRSSRAAVS
jgi:glycogen debranching enzyme